jgi:SulP family sulfate permease
MIALLEARRAGLFGRGHWLPNIVAGLIVGVVALPLSMAFAIASGARPEQGIYTAIIGGACVSVFGGSRVQIAGPTGAFIAILSGVSSRWWWPHRFRRRCTFPSATRLGLNELIRTCER